MGSLAGVSGEKEQCERPSFNDMGKSFGLKLSEAECEQPHLEENVEVKSVETKSCDVSVSTAAPNRVTLNVVRPNSKATQHSVDVVHITREKEKSPVMSEEEEAPRGGSPVPVRRPRNRKERRNQGKNTDVPHMNNRMRREERRRARPTADLPEEEQQAVSEGTEQKREERQQARLYAKERAYARANKVRPAFSSLEEKEDFTGGKTSGSPGAGKEESSGAANWETMKLNSPHFHVKSYLSANYSGDSLYQAMLSTSDKDLPNSAVNKGAWFYTFRVEEVEDERLNSKLVTRSPCNYELVGDCYVQRRIWYWTGTILSSLFVLIWALSLYSSVYGLITSIFLEPINFITSSLKVIHRLLMSNGAIWLLYYVSLPTIHLAGSFVVCVLPWAIFRFLPAFYRREPYLEVRINLAHLNYGKRQNIDLYGAFLKSKMRDKDYYIASSKSLMADHKVFCYVLEKYLNGNIITHVEDIRDSEYRPMPAGYFPAHPTDFAKAPDEPVGPRAYNVVGAEIGNIDNIMVPPVTKSSLAAGYAKRIADPGLRGPLEAEQYAWMYEKACKMFRADESVSRLDGGYKAYADDMCKRKCLNASQKKIVMQQAELISEMDDEQVLAELKRMLKKTSWFVKSETYERNPEKLPSLRFIINPELFVKIVFGTFLRPIEERIYYDSKLSPHLIKGKGPDEMREVLVSRFTDPGKYIETDYSSFESSIRAEELFLEFSIYSRLLGDDAFAKRIMHTVLTYSVKDNKVLNNPALGQLHVPDIRLSGFPNTALGNAVLNVLNLKLCSHESHIKMLDYLVEGDDSLVKLEETPESSERFLKQLDSQRFISRDTKQYDVGSDASFCGMRLQDGEIVPTQAQLDKFSVIFSNTVPSEARTVVLTVSRMCCFYAKYPSEREAMIELAKEMRMNELKIHSSDVLPEIMEDYRLQECSELRTAANDMLQRIIRGDL